jgi:dUTP pyrophosphatase
MSIFSKIKELIINLFDASAEEDIIKAMLDNGAFVPIRAHKTDAGLDLRAKEGQIVPARKRAFFDTGVHIELPPNTMGEIRSRSGLFKKHGITTTGTIDVGYVGSIGVTLQNNSDVDYEVEAGDRIAQLVITPILTPEVRIVDSLTETERGNGGFGSSGR